MCLQHNLPLHEFTQVDDYIPTFYSNEYSGYGNVSHSVMESIMYLIRTNFRTENLLKFYMQLSEN